MPASEWFTGIAGLALVGMQVVNWWDNRRRANDLLSKTVAQTVQLDKIETHVNGLNVTIAETNKALGEAVGLQKGIAQERGNPMVPAS